MDLSILTSIYPGNQIFIQNLEFFGDDLAVVATCNVPLGQGYSVKICEYVTAENYVRIFSQCSYVLAHYLLENNIISLDDFDAEKFVSKAVRHDLFYRSLAMSFHKRVSCGEEFEMRLELSGIREIRKITDFILFTFTGKRTVISGELQFIAVP